MPLFSICCPGTKTQVFVQIARPTILYEPRTGIDEQLLIEHQQMGVSHIPLCNLEFEHLLPAGDAIIAD
jgi:hypothetical protein